MSEKSKNLKDELLSQHLMPGEPLRIEFLDENDMLYQLDSSINIVDKNFLVINPPRFRGKSYELSVDSTVSIIFFRKDGLLYAFTDILGKQQGEEAKLKLSLPYNIQIYERRRTKRVRASLKLEIEYYPQSNFQIKKVLNERTYDISVGGVSYLSDTPLGNYNNIQCKLFLDSSISNPVIADCKYITSRLKRIRGNILYQVALEFIQISKNDISRLQQKCYKASFY